MVARQNWPKRIDGIIRSRHYTWIGDGLAGDSIPDALSEIVSDAMNICRREGIDWQTIVETGQRQFDAEEARLAVWVVRFRLAVSSKSGPYASRYSSSQRRAAFSWSPHR